MGGRDCCPCFKRKARSSQLISLTGRHVLEPTEHSSTPLCGQFAVGHGENTNHSPMKSCVPTAAALCSLRSLLPSS